MIYLTALIGCVVFYWAYREWLSWLLLMALIFLPWLSLLLSLPAMLTCRVQVQCSPVIAMGEKISASHVGKCRLPMPAIRGRMRVSRVLTGESWMLRSGKLLPTTHCGALEIKPVRIWVYDHLGLLRLPVCRKEAVTVLVRPNIVTVPNPPDMSRYVAGAWKPKPGGGFAENHELRLYRPGDNLRQVHWKLSAKTGKMIVREPIEAIRGRALLTMELTGTPSQLDDKLGRLHYMSRYLIDREVPHQIHCLTGNGMETFHVADHDQAQAAIDALLRCAPAQKHMIPNYMAASWRYHIGGGDHEG